MYINLEKEFKESNLDNVIYKVGDSLEYLKKIPSNSISLIITSPPYNIGKDYEVKTSIEQYLDGQKKIIDELIRILKDNGSICWQVGNYVNNGEIFPLDIYYYSIFKEKKLKLRNRIIWRFGHGLHGKNRFSGRYETILWFTKGDDYTFNLDDVRIPAKYPGKRHYKGKKKGELSGNPKGKNPEDVWEVVLKDWEKEIWEIPNVKANHCEKTIHPCQYPVELVERCVLALTNENEIVLDPFAGVGSTLIGSLKNNRKAIGFDKEKKYVEVGKENIIKFYSGELKTREITQKIHKPKANDKVAQIPEEWKKIGVYKDVECIINKE